MNDEFYDPESRLIILNSAGFHSPKQVAERACVVSKLVDEARRDCGYARILNFACDLPVQSSEVAASSTQQAGKTNPLDDSRDKFAMVISSTLARMQMQRTIGSTNRRVFATEKDARAWLNAD